MDPSQLNKTYSDTFSKICNILNITDVDEFRKFYIESYYHYRMTKSVDNNLSDIIISDWKMKLRGDKIDSIIGDE